MFTWYGRYETLLNRDDMMLVAFYKDVGDQETKHDQIVAPQPNHGAVRNDATSHRKWSVQQRPSILHNKGKNDAPTPQERRRTAPKRKAVRRILVSDSDDEGDEDANDSEEANSNELEKEETHDTKEKDAAVEWEPRTMRKNTSQKKGARPPVRKTLDSSAFAPFEAADVQALESRLKNNPRPGEVYLNAAQVNMMLKIDRSNYPDRDLLQRGVQPTNRGQEWYDVSDGLHAYDEKGKRIANFAVDGLSSVGFLALPNGTIVSPHSPEPLLVFFDEENETCVAPGVVRAFAYDKRHADASYIGIQVVFKWFVKDDEFDVYYHSLEQDAQYVPEESSLSLECIATSVHMHPFKLFPHLCYDYWSSLNRWTQEHNRKRKFCRLGSSVDDTSVVYDALEFYYAPDKWIWRTAVGQLIQTTYVMPWKSFGQCPDTHNINMITNVMMGAKLVWHEHEATDGVCCACKYKRVLRYVIACRDATYDVGCECFERLRYMHEIAVCMRSARERPFSHALISDVIDTISVLADCLRMSQKAFD